MIEDKLKRCSHGVILPHECRACFLEAPISPEDKRGSICLQDIRRSEDMGEGALILFQQEDGDWIIRLVGRTLCGDLATCSIEFCTPSTGGGASPRTWNALTELAKAMQEDNEAPQRFGLRAEHHATTHGVQP